MLIEFSPTYCVCFSRIFWKNQVTWAICQFGVLPNGSDCITASSIESGSKISEVVFLTFTKSKRNFFTLLVITWVNITDKWILYNLIFILILVFNRGLDCYVNTSHNVLCIILKVFRIAVIYKSREFRWICSAWGWHHYECHHLTWWHNTQTKCIIDSTIKFYWLGRLYGATQSAENNLRKNYFLEKLAIFI